MTDLAIVGRLREMNGTYTQYQAAQELGLTQPAVSILCKKHGIKWKWQRRDQKGEKNHNYINGLGRSTVERATRRVVVEAKRCLIRCERCGYIDPSRQELPRHHKDRNRSNNSPDNIEVLCWGCHNKEHMPEKARDEFGRFL